VEGGDTALDPPAIRRILIAADVRRTEAVVSQAILVTDRSDTPLDRTRDADLFVGLELRQADDDIRLQHLPAHDIDMFSSRVKLGCASGVVVRDPVRRSTVLRDWAQQAAPAEIDRDRTSLVPLLKGANGAEEGTLGHIQPQIHGTHGLPNRAVEILHLLCSGVPQDR
jgi:hypothetical protein